MKVKPWNQITKMLHARVTSISHGLGSMRYTSLYGKIVIEADFMFSKGCPGRCDYCIEIRKCKRPDFSGATYIAPIEKWETAIKAINALMPKTANRFNLSLGEIWICNRAEAGFYPQVAEHIRMLVNKTPPNVLIVITTKMPWAQHLIDVAREHPSRILVLTSFTNHPEWERGVPYQKRIEGMWSLHNHGVKVGTRCLIVDDKSVSFY